jgi:hypothetical protein
VQRRAGFGALFRVWWEAERVGEEEQERRGEGRLCNCKDEVGENSLSLFF